jgi:hypothetical protein
MIAAIPALTGCDTAPTPEQQALLRQWWELNHAQSDGCTAAYIELTVAVEHTVDPEDAAAARRTAACFKSAAREVASFGDLPGTGTSEGIDSRTHPCTLSLQKFGDWAEKVELVSAGNDRPSLRQSLQQDMFAHSNLSDECVEDTLARAHDLGVPTSDLEGLDALANPPVPLEIGES